jgi:outer membrane protein assembly factor BamB
MTQDASQLEPHRVEGSPRRCGSLLLLVVVASTSILADEWPGWLGPQRDGVWREKGILTSFPAAGPAIVWRQNIAGGYGGPAVVGQRVFVMDRVRKPDDPKVLARLAREFEKGPNHHYERGISLGTERVLCLDDANGQVLWTHEYDCPYTTAVEYANGPRVTPTVDGDRVYTLGAEGNLFCLRLETGAVVWESDWKKEFKVDVPTWGFAAHPLVDGNKLICVIGGTGTTAVAFDMVTGKELWRSLTSKNPGYSAPMIFQIGARRQLVVWHGEAVNGLDPETGKVFWTIPIETHVGMAIATPRRLGDALFLTGFQHRSTLITLGEKPMVRWRGNSKLSVASTLATPFLMDGHIYSCGSDGGFICARMEDGQRLWKDYGPVAGGKRVSWGNVFTIPHEDRFFLANDAGELIIARLSPAGYEEIDRTKIIAATTPLGRRNVVWSHPAFAHRRVYARNDKEIVCLSLAKETVGGS